MKTAASCSIFVLLSVGALACQSAKPNDDAVAGGQTTDFTGEADVDSCEAQSEERPEDTPRLGFSAAELLASAAGVFEIPIRWLDGCNDLGGDVVPACDEANARFRSLDGVDTVLRVEIAGTGAPALVDHPTAEQPACAQLMQVPVTAHFTTLDGLINERLDTTLSSECGRSVGVGFGGRLSSELTGSVAEPSWGLGDGTTVTAAVYFVEDRIWVDLEFHASTHQSLLATDLPPFGESGRWVPRTSVEQQPGSPTPSGHCGHINY